MELKFRVWDNVDYMSSALTLSDLQEGKIKFTPDCIVMQFTGLHDKNGKEIYEGDILQYRYQYWVRKYGDQRELVNDVLSKNQVVFTRGEFRLSAVCNLSQLPVYFEGGENINAEWDSRYSEFEIIGNIHQNPDLL